MRENLTLIGQPEVSYKGGVKKKSARANANAGKLVAIKVSRVKTQILQLITHSKTALLTAGLLYFWEDLAAYADPTQHYAACILAAVVVVEALTFKFSKIQ